MLELEVTNNVGPVGSRKLTIPLKGHEKAELPGTKPFPSFLYSKDCSIKSVHFHLWIVYLHERWNMATFKGKCRSNTHTWSINIHTFIYALEKINMKPKNGGLVQMIFSFSIRWCLGSSRSFSFSWNFHLSSSFQNPRCTSGAVIRTSSRSIGSNLSAVISWPDSDVCC